MAKLLNLLKLRSFVNAGDSAVEVSITSDTQPRLRVDAGGKHTWGAGGTTAGDTTLYRSAADTLKTDDSFIAAGGLTVKTTEIDTASASSGQVLQYDGTKFAPTTPSRGATVSDNVPSSPTAGQVWFESDTGKTFVYYDSYWVEISGGRGDTNPIGSVTAFAGASAPTGWLLCAGQTVSRTVYASLFTVVGTTYNTGGEAGTDFRLPDLRGRTIAGIDNMGGTATNRLTSAGSGINGVALGATGGTQNHTLTMEQMPTHSHQVMTVIPHSDGPIVSGEYINAGLAGGSARLRYTNYQEDRGSSQAHNITQPTIILNYIIKAL
jgi:microcystin-dependent protein